MFARAKTFTLSGTFLRARARKGGLAKAAVHRDKLARRERWRLAKAAQRAANRAAEAEARRSCETLWPPTG